MAQEIADSTLLDTWASSGNIVEPDISKIIEGWQLGEQPPHEYMNWLQNTFGSKLNHILKNGVASWNNTTQYLAGSSVQHTGNVWLCKTTNTNSEPADVNANWKRIITVESLTTVLGGYVATTGNQTITGVKTFSSIIVGNISGNAETVSNGVYTIGNQTITGVKTFSSIIVGNISGNAETVSNGVYTIGNQTITGVKTFSSSPIVPTPTTGTQAVNKDYVDNLKTIATGTATFNSTTNNINLTGIGIGVEIGDVIQISGADDTKNNSEFTVEVITDNNNIIVNQAHANKGTTKNVANRVSDTGVTVKLLAKWYNAPLGLGQGWVSMIPSRVSNTNYTNLINRTIKASISAGEGVSFSYRCYVDNIFIGDTTNASPGVTIPCILNIPRYSSYIANINTGAPTIAVWSELR